MTNSTVISTREGALLISSDEAEKGMEIASRLDLLNDEFKLDEFLGIVREQFSRSRELSDEKRGNLIDICAWLFKADNSKRLNTHTNSVSEIDAVDLETLANGLNYLLAVSTPTDPFVIGDLSQVLDRIIQCPADTNSVIVSMRTKHSACEAYLRLHKDNVGIGQEGFEKLVNLAFNDGGFAFAGLLWVIPRLLKIGSINGSLDRQSVLVITNRLERKVSSTGLSYSDKLKLFALQEIVANSYN